MRKISNLLFAILLCGLAANARWHSSYPHFTPEIKENPTKSTKATKPAKPQTISKPQESVDTVVVETITSDVAGDSIAADNGVKPNVKSPFKAKLKAVIPRIKKLGEMHAETEAQRSAKEKERDAIVEFLSQDTNSLTAKQTSQLNVIIRRLNSSTAVGNPNDETTFLGEKKSEGSRSYCNKIIIYINNIISE